MITTAIIPAFNEEISIGSIVIKTKKYADYVIVIDDGSTDNTARIAKSAGGEVIRHPKNMGKREALKTGFHTVRQKGTNIIVIIDADGYYNPDEIPQIVAPIASGDADMVIGSRCLKGNNINIPFYRRIEQKVLDLATNMNREIHITDVQSGFRAFDIDIVETFRFEQNGFSIESEMLAEAMSAGLKIKEVCIGVRYDVDGSTENPIKHRLKVLVNILQNMDYRRPIYYFTVPGIILGTIGSGMGLKFLQDFHRGDSLHFGSTLLMILLTLVGFFFAFTGIILHFMSRLSAEFDNIYEH